MTTPPSDPDHTDGLPVAGLTLDVLHSLAQDVHHCGQPMRYVKSTWRWTGTHGSGTEEQHTFRACTSCGATLAINSYTPS